MICNRILLCFVSLFFIASHANAQPSDAKIKKDLTSSGVISVKLYGRGSRVWNQTYRQYFWERTGEVLRKANIAGIPNAKLAVGGFARYTLIGGGYRFQKFAVAYNRYYGIPAPTQAEVLKLVNGDLAGFLGYHYHSIVGNVMPIKFPSKVDWNWHTPNSVTLQLVTGFSEKVSSTQTEKKSVLYDVRLYRDSVKSKWNKFHSSTSKMTTLGKTTYADDDLAAMKTLAQLDAEKGAKSQMSSLPNVAIPDFKTDLEFFAFLHNALRAGDAKKFEAILRKTLSPFFYEANSSVLLNSQGEDLIQQNIKRAFQGKSKYAEQYGPDPIVAEYQANRISFANADDAHKSTFKVALTGGKWENGVKVGEKFMISGLEIWLNTEPDEIARLRSMQPAQRFAASGDARTLSQLGGELADQNQAAEFVAQANNIKWTTYSSKDARMEISLPGAPKETKGTTEEKYPTTTLAATKGKLSSRAISVVFPNRPGRGQSQNYVAIALNKIAAELGMDQMQLSEISSGTFGRVAIIENNGERIKARVWVEGDVLYQLILRGDMATMNALDDRAFFESFKALRP